MPLPIEQRRVYMWRDSNDRLWKATENHKQNPRVVVCVGTGRIRLKLSLIAKGYHETHILMVPPDEPPRKSVSIEDTPVQRRLF